MNRPTLVLERLQSARLLRYIVASALSLAVDMGGFTILLAIGAAAAPSAAAGYALGIISHWLISSRKVFAGSVAMPGPARTRQKVLFVVSALIGLVITTAIVGAGTVTGAEPHLAKSVAIVVSFTVTWLLRTRMIFR